MHNTSKTTAVSILHQSAYCTPLEDHAFSENEHQPCDADLEGEEWTLDESGACFILGDPNKNEEVEGHSHTPPVAVNISNEKLADCPAFNFLETAGLTQLPNLKGVGIGVHYTTNTFQVRYPAAHQKSTGRTFGNLKGKGYVPPVAALLQCLLWAWEQHASDNPNCTVSKERIQVLVGALKVNLGHDVK